MLVLYNKKTVKKIVKKKAGNMTPKEQAMFCISHGIHVIAGNGDRAIVKDTAGGTLDKELVDIWWNEKPDRNILISLKNSNLICVDLDQHHEMQNGLKVFDALWKANNNGRPLETYSEKTPTGNGCHIFFKVKPEFFDKPIASEIADGVEIKTSFTPIAPSKRTDGSYQHLKSEYTASDISGVSECPEWLIKLIHEPRKTKQATSNNSYNNSYRGSGGKTYTTDMWLLFKSGATQGNRNNDTNRILHYWKTIEIEPKDCYELLTDFNNRTSPPLDEAELTQIWKSVWKDK